jgi:hypothetical protein
VSSAPKHRFERHYWIGGKRRADYLGFRHRNRIDATGIKSLIGQGATRAE